MMSKKKVPGPGFITLGEYMQKRYPSLRDTPAKVLEEPFLQMIGLRKKVPNRETAEASLKKFEKDPAGPDSEINLGLVLVSMSPVKAKDEAAAIRTLQSIFDTADFTNQETREVVAEKVVKKIMDWVDNESPEFRKAVFSIIMERLKGKTAIGKTAERLAREMPFEKVRTVPKKADGTLIALIHQHMGENENGVPKPGVSRVYHLQVDRNGKVKDVETLSKDEHERIWLRAAQMLVPKSRRMKIFAAIGAAALLAFGTVTITCFPEIRASETWQRITTSNDEIKRKIREAVTLKEEVIIRSKQVINKNSHGGELSVEQIFDIFQFVSWEIKYQSDSHPFIPQADYLTLKGKGGDCKSKTVLLASMLEASGAKTLMFAMIYADGKGHAYVGVRISKKTDDGTAKTVAALVQDAVKARCPPLAWRQMKYKPLLRQIYDPGIAGTYLILDSVYAFPGIASNDRIKSEIIIETRPGLDGNIPKEFE